jgi:hypothetical protein
MVALLGCWRELWPLVDVGPGFLPLEQAAQLQARQQELDARRAELDARLAEATAGAEPEWVGSTCRPPTLPATGVQRRIADRSSPRLRAAMMRVASQEEIFFSVNRRYTPNLSELGLANDGDVLIRIVYAAPASWAAVVGLIATPDRGCALWYGSSLEAPLTTPGGRPAGRSGEIVCDP